MAARSPGRRRCPRAIRVVTKREPTPRGVDGAAVCVARVRAREVQHDHLHDRRPTLAVGAGQMSRVDAVNVAVMKAKGRGAGRLRRGVGRLLPVPGRPRRDRAGRSDGRRAAWRLCARRGSDCRCRRARHRDGLHRTEALPALMCRTNARHHPSDRVAGGGRRVWCGQAVRKAERSTGNDLIGYLAASEALYAQEDPYHLPGQFPYIYPLFLATVVRPLASLSARSATIAWFALQWLCLLYIAWPARVRHWQTRDRRRHRDRAPRRGVWGRAADRVPQRPGEPDRCRAGRRVRSAWPTAANRSARSLLGAAVAIKLTPALMLVYWLVRRRVRLAAQAGLWALVFILLPWLVVGERLWPLYGDYLHGFIFARTHLRRSPRGRDLFQRVTDSSAG